MLSIDQIKNALKLPQKKRDKRQDQMKCMVKKMNQVDL